MNHETPLAQGPVECRVRRWILTSDRLPNECETVDGRVPVIDADGYLVYAILIGGHLVSASNIDAVWWLPVTAPNGPDQARPEAPKAL